MSFETLFGICSAHLSCGDRRFEISLRPSITKVPCFAQEAVFRLCSASPDDLNVTVLAGIIDEYHFATVPDSSPCDGRRQA